MRAALKMDRLKALSYLANAILLSHQANGDLPAVAGPPFRRERCVASHSPPRLSASVENPTPLNPVLLSKRTLFTH